MKSPTSQRWPADEVAIAAVRAGDRAAFEWIMRRHNQRAFRIARSILRSDAEAEDAIQDAYLSAYIHLNDFRGQGRFSSWLYRIVIRQAWKRRRRAQVSESLDGEGGTDQSPSPERQVAGRELAHHVELAIDTLGDDYRTTFMLHAVDGMTAAETAALLGISEHTVRSRVHRAREQLRSELRQRTELADPRTPPSLSPRTLRSHRGACARTHRGHRTRRPLARVAESWNGVGAAAEPAMSGARSATASREGASHANRSKSGGGGRLGRPSTVRPPIFDRFAQDARWESRSTIWKAALSQRARLPKDWPRPERTRGLESPLPPPRGSLPKKRLRLRLRLSAFVNRAR